MTHNIAALILAAGFSSRMGAFKPLLPFGGSSVIGTVVSSFRQAGVDHISVVVGWEAGKLQPVLTQLQVTAVMNDHYEAGMFSSVLAGLRSLPEHIEGIFLLPVDTPLVTPGSIKAMLRRFRQTNAAVVYPAFQGRRGHPPLISGRHRQDILAAGPGTLKTALARLEPAITVEVPDRGVLLDMDTPADYETLKTFSQGRALPAREEAIALLKALQSSETVIRHCLAVAATGRQLAEGLNRAGMDLNIAAVEAGCLLHDIAKGQPDHARCGARVMERHGYPLLAGIVGAHMDLIFEETSCLDEAAIVFLADKLTHEGQVVSVDERFQPALQKLAGQPDKLVFVKQRLLSAYRIQAAVMEFLGVCFRDDIKLPDY